MKWERIHRVGAGLHNLGNTCFLNATVQCLTYTPPLANYLLSKEHSRACEWGGPARRAAGPGRPRWRGGGAPARPCSQCCAQQQRAGVGMHLLCSLLPVSPSRGRSRVRLAFPGRSSGPKLCILVSGEALSLLGIARTKMGPTGSAGFRGAELGVPNGPCLWGLREGRAEGCVQAADAVYGWFSKGVWWALLRAVTKGSTQGLQPRP